MDELPDFTPRDEGFKNEVAGSPGTPEDRLAAIRAAVEQDLEDVKAGRVTDPDAALDRIESMLDEIEAAKRG